MIDPTFVESERRGIDLTLGPDWPGFNQTLADSISSLPYRGEQTTSLSTYWLDLVLFRLVHWSDPEGREQALVSGNETELVKVGDRVVARSLYDVFDDEHLPVDVLVAALHQWRSLVIARGGSVHIPPELRRNPIVLPPL